MLLMLKIFFQAKETLLVYLRNAKQLGFGFFNKLVK